MTDFQKFKRSRLIAISVGGGFMIPSIIGLILNDQLLAIITGVIGIFIICIMSWDFLRHRVIFCKDCGHKFNYETEVGYDLRDEVVHDKKRVATVDFECKCSKCGSTREFFRRFETAYIDDKGRVHHRNLRNEIKSLFKG